MAESIDWEQITWARLAYVKCCSRLLLEIILPNCAVILNSPCYLREMIIIPNEVPPKLASTYIFGRYS